MLIMLFESRLRIAKESNLLSDKSEVRSCFKSIFDVFPSFDSSQKDSTGKQYTIYKFPNLLHNVHETIAKFECQ